MLLSPLGYREPAQIHRIVRQKARVEGAMASIVEWQSLKMQEYRHQLHYRLIIAIQHFFELFGVRRPVRYEPAPAPAGEFDQALHLDHPEAPSFLEQYLQDQPAPQARIQPEVTPTPSDTCQSEAADGRLSLPESTKPESERETLPKE